MGFHLAWFAAVVREESVDVLELAEEGFQIGDSPVPNIFTLPQFFHGVLFGDAFVAFEMP